MHKWIVLTISSLLMTLLGACQPDSQPELMAAQAADKAFAVNYPAAKWKQILPPDTFRVMREHGTERAFSGKYDRHKADGIYYCAACGNHIFDSRHKFDSGTGWPSYYQPLASERIGTQIDTSFFSTRTEVHCARCGGHLGHVFDDGPKPTGLRYCINSVALDFRERQASPPPLRK